MHKSLFPIITKNVSRQIVQCQPPADIGLNTFIKRRARLAAIFMTTDRLSSEDQSSTRLS